jgi:hypothetical protein
MAFFKDGFQKLVGAVKGDDPAPSGGYRGQLSAATLRVSEGTLLGPGGAEPQTLTSWCLGGWVEGWMDLLGGYKKV